MVIPGFQTLVQQFQMNQFFSATVLGGGILGLLAMFRRIPSDTYHFIKARTTVTLNFNSTDKMYFFLQKWVAEQTRFDRFQKNYNAISQRVPMDGSPSSVGFTAGDDPDEENKPTFVLTPWIGTYLIRYKGKWMKINCNRNDPAQAKSGNGVFVYETMTISYLGRSLKPAYGFLEDICATYKASKQKNVNVYIPSRSGGYWQEHNKLLHRSLDSIVMRDSSLLDVVEDLRKFRLKETEAWYLDKGIPYHSGYLFQGPPGTGKTTSIYTIASQFNLNVHFMTISPNISDEDFFGLVSNTEKDSILVMEDIDCIFDKERNKKDDNKLSFSSMLNALDGFCSKHGSIVILTTNHPERLNEALVRKGRIDMTVDFKLCNRDQIERMFLKFFPGEVEAADAFGMHFYDDMFSPVELQGYFLQNKTAQAALKNVDEFVKQKAENERKKIQAVA